MANNLECRASLIIECMIIKNKIIKACVVLKSLILITVWIYLLLAQPLVGLANSKDETVSNNVRTSSDVNKDKKPITISVSNASLKETVLGICRSYHISVIGVESLTGNITATVQGNRQRIL